MNFPSDIRRKERRFLDPITSLIFWTNGIQWKLDLLLCFIILCATPWGPFPHHASVPTSRIAYIPDLHSSGTRIFPRRGEGAATPKMNVKSYYLVNVFPKTVWNWKNLDLGGALPWHPPDPLMFCSIARVWERLWQIWVHHKILSWNLCMNVFWKWLDSKLVLKRLYRLQNDNYFTWLSSRIYPKWMCNT